MGRLLRRQEHSKYNTILVSLHGMDCSTIFNAALRHNALQGLKQGGPLDPPELMGRAVTLV